MYAVFNNKDGPYVGESNVLVLFVDEAKARDWAKSYAAAEGIEPRLISVKPVSVTISDTEPLKET